MKMKKLNINLSNPDNNEYEVQNCTVNNSLASGLSYQISISKNIPISTISEVLRIELSKYGIGGEIKEYESFQEAVRHIYDYYDKKINYPNEYPKDYYDNLIFLIASFLNFAVNLYLNNKDIDCHLYNKRAISYNDILLIINNFFEEVK